MMFVPGTTGSWSEVLSTCRSAFVPTLSEPLSVLSVGTSSACVEAVLTRCAPLGTLAPTPTGTVIVTEAPGASVLTFQSIVWPAAPVSEKPAAGDAVAVPGV